MKWGCRGHWGHWGYWGCWGHWDHNVLRPGKSLLSIPESSRLLNSDLFWCFENHFFWWNHEISFFNSCNFSVGSCWGQPKLHFWKLVLIIKISTSQDFKTTFKYNLSCIFLSLRAKLKNTLRFETPCIRNYEKNNNARNIRHLFDESFVPVTQLIILKIVGFLPSNLLT